MPDRKKKRGRILKCAALLFARFGLEKVTFEQIARACRLTRTAIYYYFPSKEAILEHLWNLGWRVLYRSIQPFWQEIERDPMGTLERAITAQYHVFKKYEPLMQCLFRMRGEDLARLYPNLQLDRTHQQEYLRFYRQLIRTGMEQGVFKPVDPDITMRAIHGTIWGLLFEPGRDETATIEELNQALRQFLT